MADDKKPMAAPKTTTTKKKTPGPVPPVWADLSSTLDQIKSMSPAERQISRTKLGEELVDLWMLRAVERLQSSKLRSQDMVAIAGFMKANAFVIKPDSGKEDYLDRLKRERLEQAADEEKRLKRMAKAKEQEEKRVEQFYAKVEGKPVTKRLNTGPAGSIGIMEGEFLEEGNDK